MLKIDKAHLRGIWVASERRYCFCRFTLDPFSHHVSLCSISNFPFATWQFHCWLLDCVEVICGNVARAACTLWSRGSWLGGASVSTLCFCCFLAHRLLYGIFVICCSLLFYFAIPIPGVMEMLSSLLIRFRWLWTDQLITDRAVFGLCPVLFLVWLCGFCFAFALCFLFGLCWFLVLARWQLNGLRIDPTQFYFWCTLSILWCCHCINSRNLNMQLAFRLA